MRLVVSCLVGVLALAGCGGSETKFERETIEDQFTEQMRGRLAAQDGTMDRLTCVEDGDDRHWRCISTARIAGQAYSLTVSVTCDGETGQCLSEPATVGLLP